MKCWQQSKERTPIVGNCGKTCTSRRLLRISLNFNYNTKYRQFKMCEQTEVEYLDGDVVWVKLGAAWWPGEVKELSKLPPEIVKDFKKSPIAVVKFFQEDQYEYVKNINHIYKYNCRRKNEFIKKGLDMHRAKNVFMDKFPTDVCFAETLTGGDPDIITNDEFAPEKRPSYHGIFGSASPKKPKTGIKGRPSTGSTPKSTRTPTLVTPQRRTITHPRFVGKSDYQVRILEQSTPSTPTSHYTCHICDFESSRLNVIVLHNRSHSNGTYVSPTKTKGKKSSPKKIKRKSFATTNTIDEDIELFRQGLTITTEEETDSEKEQKDKKKVGGKRKNNKAANTTSKKAKVSSICNNLLADWSDEETEEKTDNTTEPNTENKEDKESKDKESIDKEINKDKEGDDKKKEQPESKVQNELLADWDENEESTKTSSAVLEEKKEEKKKEEKASEKPEEKSSCFDFDDEEESSSVLEKSPGRKIPRVIPSKRTSKDADELTEKPEKSPEKPKKSTEKSGKSTEKPEKSTEKPERSTEKPEKSTEKTESPQKETKEIEEKETAESDIAAFNNLLEETAVPDFTSLPDVNLKKIDESIDKTNGVMKKTSPENVNETEETNKEPEHIIATIPKKRIVRNFEEFENLLNEQKTVEEEKTKSVEVSKLKSQLMSKLHDSPKKSPVRKVDTPELDSEIDSKDESQSSESFNKKLSQSESEDTDVEKKDICEETTSKDLDIAEEKPLVIEDKIEEKEEIIEDKIEEKEEMIETIQTEKETEPVIEEKSDLCEEVPMELEPVVEEQKEDKIEEEKMEEDLVVEETPQEKQEEVVEPDIEKEETSQDLPKEETRSQKMLVDISDICIDNSDNLSGLSTLAAVSELTGNLYDKQELAQESPITELEAKEDTSTIDEVTNPPSSITDDTESRDTPVQDELPNTPQPKPVQTLANFSMDFSDSNSESTIIKTVTQEDSTNEKIDNIETTTTDSDESKIEIEKTVVSAEPNEFETIENEIEKITSIETTSDKLNSFPENISTTQESVETTIAYSDFQLADTGTSIPGPDFKITEPPSETLESEIAKLTDTQPGHESVVQEQQQNTTSSKLLEILTDSKKSSEQPVEQHRTIISQNQKVQMLISGDKSISKKFDPKTSKFVIKSAMPKSVKSNKPIILSEKIIKPVSDDDNVSVKKVTSKRTYQDVEDIDTFIIQKPTKKSSSGELDQQDIILTPKTDIMKFKGGRRGKPKIIEQTIIKAADVVQTPVSESNFDDSMFDINSMPIVLSDQILTPESIENIPMVMTDLIPASTVPTAGQTTVQTVITEKPQVIKRGGAIQQVKLLNKGKVTSQSESSPKLGQNVVVKNIMPRSMPKASKVYQTGSKTLKHNPAIVTTPGKPGKFIILPTTTSASTGVSKYTVGKRVTTIKSSAVTSPTSSKQLKSVQSVSGEPTGNKIMIVTNQQGVQSRVLLTPAQQKLLGCKVPGTKVTTKSQIKGGVMQKSILTSKGTIIGAVNSGLKSPTIGSQTIVTSKGQMVTTQSGQQMLVTSEGQVLTPISQQQMKSNLKAGQKIKIQSSRVILPEKDTKAKMSLMGTKTKTVLIKGSQGQTLKKFQTSGGDTKNIIVSQGGQKSLVSLTGQQMQAGLSNKQVVVTSKGQFLKQDGKLISKQAAEKLQRMQSTKTVASPRIMSKTPRTQMLLSPTKQHGNVQVPPLAPITSQVKKEIAKEKLLTTIAEKEKIEQTTSADKTEKQPNQLIIQDALGNQTTVTEGQILALPSGETVDGQPQSYVLVTVDETGNLVPISNDTLMSLDPNLAAGGDMSNIVLQIDPGAQDAQEAKPAETVPATDMPVVEEQQIIEQPEQMLVDNQQLIIQDQTVLPATTEPIQEQQEFVTEEQQVTDPNLLQDQQQTAVACSINNGDSSQQLIITGDPESTQKFLASLSEGNTDLTSLLSGTDGNIIINTDGQQILLNTDSENQILLSVNSDNLGLIQGATENDPSPYVSQQSIKNQDILAAALADTDVFQQDSAEKSNQALTKVSASQPQLSPNSSLYPMNVGSVLETSLTLNSPIMTPLEVPSVNNKKISSEESLITQVPSSLELPITITDPSISQTVNQQVMLGNELQTNLELPISISDTTITSIRSTEMSSPNFVYSLPTLDETSDLDQKRSYVETSTVITTDSIYSSSLTGSMSMPLLTEEPEIQPEEQEQIPTSIEETLVVSSAPETSTVDTEIPPPDSEMQPLDSEIQPLDSEIQPLHSEIQPLESESQQLDTEIQQFDTEIQPPVVEHEPPIVEHEPPVVEHEPPIVEKELPVVESEPPVVENEFTETETEIEPAEPEKIQSELHIPIEEELDLNPADICNSLSEPPPGMFDKSAFSNFLNRPEDESEVEVPITSNDTPITEPEPINSLPMLSEGAEQEITNSEILPESEKQESNLELDYGVSDQQMTQEVRSELLETPNSELNSPRLDIDENSAEIPIQPQIITNLSETFAENSSEDYETGDKRRVNENDDDEIGAKRSKLSCD